MSYGIGLFFKKLNKVEDIFPLMNEINGLFKKDENLYEFLDQFKYYRPNQMGLCELFLPNDPYSGDSYWVGRIKEGMFTELFTFTYYYWPKYNLVGFQTGAPIKALDNIFDSYFYFQNSTDQNYPQEEYKGCLQEIVAPFFDRVKGLKNNKEILKLMHKTKYPESCADLDDINYDEFFTSNKLDKYAIRECVYALLEDDLDIYKACFMGKSDKYYCFSNCTDFRGGNYLYEKVSKYFKQLVEDKKDSLLCEYDSHIKYLVKTYSKYLNDEKKRKASDKAKDASDGVSIDQSAEAEYNDIFR